MENEGERIDVLQSLFRWISLKSSWAQSRVFILELVYQMRIFERSVKSKSLAILLHRIQRCRSNDTQRIILPLYAKNWFRIYWINHRSKKFDFSRFEIIDSVATCCTRDQRVSRRFIVDFHRICEVILNPQLNPVYPVHKSLRRRKKTFALCTLIFSEEDQQVLEKDIS